MSIYRNFRAKFIRVPEIDCFSPRINKKER
jgi:hypothetical protein